MSFIKKIRRAQQKRLENDGLNESYEGRYIREMNNEIEEGFAKKGEEIGMNEMCNNVIDNIIEGKEINELFNPPMQYKKTYKSFSNKLPKVNNNISTIKEDEKKTNNGLFSEKFIKPHKKNYKNLLILPLLNHKFKNNANVKFREGETEKILAFEYYQNSYKQCVKMNHSQEPLNAIRENYKLMWKNVDSILNKNRIFDCKK